MIRGSAVFVFWTLTSFLCHQSATYFFHYGSTYLPDRGLLLPILLTLSQGLTCLCLVDIQHQKDKLFYIMAVSHMVATFATNCSMAFMSASSTFAIKLMEPITSAVVQRLVLSTSLSTSTLVSLPLIVSGAVVFAGNPLATSSLSVGVPMALVSNIVLAVRNVTMKLRQNESKKITLRSAAYILGVVAYCIALTVCVYFLAPTDKLPYTAAAVIGTMFMSSFLHVAYSYVSTNIVLLYMNVVSHAVSNILKRLIVVLLLYMFGHRQAIAWNFAGLIVCAIGLLIYVRGKVTFLIGKDKITKDITKVPVMSSSCKKMSFIILAVFTIGAVSNIAYTNTPGSARHLYGDYGRSFGRYSHKIMEERDLYPDMSSSYLAQNRSEIKTFLQWRLLDHKHQTNLLSPLLRKSTELIQETQRIHFNVFKDLIGKYKYAMLFDIAAFENKGDPAITAGEVYLIRRLGIEIVFYCSCKDCANESLRKHVGTLSKRYSKEELVILFHGGGNLVGYAFNNLLRGKLFPIFRGFQMVIFPQSVFVRGHKYSGKTFEYCQRIYCCNPDLTIVLRDKQSLQIALKYWNNGTNLVLAPDMAFQIGSVRRFMSPSYDILWLKRGDKEAPKYSDNTLMSTGNVTVCVEDWWLWKTNRGKTSMETAFLMANNGLVFLQRGRVVITDRLHGHILSTLLNIPHVLIDNQYKKLSSYHNTWTRSLENVFITNDTSKALDLALKLLLKYNEELPPISPIMEVKEYPVPK